MTLPLRCSYLTPPPSLPSSFPSSHSLLKFSPPTSLKFTLPALRPRSNPHRLSLSSVTASLSAVDSHESSHIQNEKKLLLEVKGLTAVIAESKQQILKGVNLTIYEGEVHAIMGKNGSGKSTLAKVLVGHPNYEVTGGSVVFKGENLVEMEPEERSLAGLFMRFQSPVAIPGVNNIDFLNMAYNARRRKLGLPELGPIEFYAYIFPKLELVNMKADFLNINVNEGFSGGERKRNEILQLAKTVISKVRPMLEGTVRALYSKENFPRYFSVADLGCSSGPNTLIVTYEMIDAIVGLCRETGHSPPELTVFLNDLPSNDFNTNFKLLPDFYGMLKKEKGNDAGPCFIAGMPGSFYGRLFPSKSLDFVHSSYSVHWLSKVPQGINNNKGNIYMGKTSPHNVFEAYMEQFQSDFSLFLRSRADEIKLGGQMILTFIGRNIKDPTSRDCCLVWELLAKCLLDMAAEGLIEEADIDTFNLPHYNPFIEEVKTIVEKEGSFVIDLLETFEVNLDANDNEENKNYMFDKFTCGKNVSRGFRAISESLLADHFGEAIIDDLFERFAERIGEHLSMEKTKKFNIVISMERK